MPAADWLTTVQHGGASAQSAQGQSQLATPASITVTRDNARDERLQVSWVAVSGASGYNLACSYSGWGAIDGSGNSGWWHCGSTTSDTSLTVDNDQHGDLSNTRSYLVAVRTVTSNPADASDWKRSERVHPAHRWLSNLTHSRSGGSITLSWTPNPWTTGYDIDCAVSGSSYTRCATLTSQDDTAEQHSVTLSSWTIGSNTYNIDDGATYDIKITSTNQWGKSAIGMLPPLIGPIPNVSNLGEASDGFGQGVESTRAASVGFTTGSNDGGYTLQGGRSGSSHQRVDGIRTAPSAWRFTRSRAATQHHRRRTPSASSTAIRRQPGTPPIPVPALAACPRTRPTSWC